MSNYVLMSFCTVSQIKRLNLESPNFVHKILRHPGLEVISVQQISSEGHTAQKSLSCNSTAIIDIH